jgi:hypothetical protein
MADQPTPQAPPPQPAQQPERPTAADMIRTTRESDWLRPKPNDR